MDVTAPLDSRAVIGGGGFGGIGSPRALVGQGLDDDGTFAVLDRCLDLGVTIIDTAYGYAAGDSHRLIGRWLAAEPARRGRVAIVDKVGVVDGSDGRAHDLSPGNVARCAAQGRARMGVDRVDVVLSHAPDSDTPIRETLAAFLDLIEQGHALHWGVSNVDAAGLTTWLHEADRAGVPGPVFVENEYSLLAREDEAAVLPTCREHGIGFLAFSPLAGGVLSGKYQRSEEPPRGSRLALRPDAAAALTPALYDRLDVLAARAASFGVSSAGLALAWVLAQPGVRPIAGVRLPAHMNALQEALDLQLTADQAAALAAEVSGP